MTKGEMKLRGSERIEAKQAVRECILSRLSRAETLSYVRAKLQRQDLEIHDIDNLKAAMKGDTERWMNSLMKDRWAYVAQYKDRVDEYMQYKKEYYRIFFANPNNPYLQKVTLDSLQNVSAALTNLYDIMPEIAGAQFTIVKDPLSKTAEDKTAETSSQQSTATATAKPVLQVE